MQIRSIRTLLFTLVVLCMSGGIVRTNRNRGGLRTAPAAGLRAAAVSG